MLNLTALNFGLKYTNASDFFTSTACLSVNLRIHILHFIFFDNFSQNHVIPLDLGKEMTTELKSLLIPVLHLNRLPHVLVIYFHIQILYFMLFTECSTLIFCKTKKIRKIKKSFFVSSRVFTHSYDLVYYIVFPCLFT